MASWCELTLVGFLVVWAHTCGFLWCELTTNHKNIVSSHCPYAISRQLGWCRSVSPSSAEMTVLVWAHTNQRQNKKISKSEKNLYVGLRSKSYWRNQKELKKFVRSSTAAGQSKKRCEVTHCTDRHTLLTFQFRSVRTMQIGLVTEYTWQEKGTRI